MRLGPGDYDAAARVLLDPAVGKGLTNMSPELVRAMLESPLAFVLMPDPDCIFFAQPFMGTALLFHQAALPGARGKRVVKAGKAAIGWLFENTQASCLVGVMSASNRPSVLMAGLLGGRRVGVIPGMYAGTDAVIMSISRATLTKGPDGGSP